MKRLFLIYILLFFSINLFALEIFGISIGLNLTFVNDNSSIDYTRRMDLGKNWIADFTEIPFQENIIISGWGFSAFFDAKYIEASVGLLFNNVRAMIRITNQGPFESQVEPGQYRIFSAQPIEAFNTSTTNFSFSLLAKIPFSINGFSIFPIGGIDYFLYLPNEFSDTHTINTLYFKFGVGSDFKKFNSGNYLRLKILYGYGLEKELQKELKRADSGDYFDYQFNGSSGLTVTLGIGFKLR